MAQFEIYALKYAGPLTSSGALLMWLQDWEKVEKRSYYIWCIKGDGESVIVDTGVSPELAEERGLAGYVNPAVILSRIHVKADEIKHVILTHMHWDHAGGVSLFPKATFYMQEEEYRFWMHDKVAERPPLKPFIEKECFLAQGHSIALQAVAVKTAKGTAIIGSDCAHTFRNYREDWPSSFIFDLVACMKTYDRLRTRASSLDLIFPGHDPFMSEGYPEVADGVTKLV